MSKRLTPCTGIRMYRVRKVVNLISLRVEDSSLTPTDGLLPRRNVSRVLDVARDARL